MADRDVRIAILGDSRDFQRAVREAADTTDSSFGRIRDIAAGVLTADLFREAGQRLFEFGRDTISTASDFNETLSRSNTVFGASAGDVEGWSRTMARSFGQSQQQALDAAGTFGNMFTQLGIGSDQAADMSERMTELASDFASFHNADISDVLEAQQAAFRGEYDALQRYVPTISAATVKQEAMRLGLQDANGQISAQAQALAVQSLMIRGAGAAQGDFGRTSDQLANKQRILSAEWQNMQTRIGQELLPVMQGLVTFTADTLLPAFDQLAAWTREHWPEIQATINNAVQSVVDFVTPIIEGFKAFWRTFGDTIVQYVQDSWTGIKEQIQGALDFIKGVVDVFVGVFTGDWGQAWDGIKEIVSGAWEFIKGTVDRALASIHLVLSAATTILAGAADAMWDGVKSAASDAWGSVRDAASTALDDVVGFVEGLPGRIAGVVSGAWDSIVQGFKDALNTVIDLINGFHVPEITIGGQDPLGDFGPSIPSATIGGWHFPQIPRLAEGGIVRARPGGTLALLAEAGLDEAVVPLQRNQPGPKDPSGVVLNFHGPVTMGQPGGAREFAREVAWQIRTRRAG